MQPIAQEEEPVGLIQGKVPDSKEEYWVAQALYKYDIRFDYQWVIDGGTSRRGGLIVDFVVWNPMMTPLEVNGDYWHRGEMDGSNKLDLIAIEQHFKKEVIVMWGEDMETPEDVEQFVRQYVAN